MNYLLEKDYISKDVAKHILAEYLMPSKEQVKLNYDEMLKDIFWTVIKSEFLKIGKHQDFIVRFLNDLRNYHTHLII